MTLIPFRLHRRQFSASSRARGNSLFTAPEKQVPHLGRKLTFSVLTRQVKSTFMLWIVTGCNTIELCIGDQTHQMFPQKQ